MELYNLSKYTRWYYSIITFALASNRIKGSEYYESHHIIPKSLGGNNNKSNLVLLTPREHYLCHLLLPKMTILPINSSKMAYAFFRMKDKYKNSKMFDRFKKAYGKLTRGENNKFYGRTHTPESLAKMSRLGKYHSDESKKKMSDSKRGMFAGELNPMYGRKHTDEWRKQHSATLSGVNHFNYGKESFNKGRTWMNNTVQSKMVTTENIPSFLSQGWGYGRL